ncbi:DUF4012 domain-containing protein [Nocardioides sp. KIGAM211]|uniref:DUF4012 domain-containing protein n=1 Tax=Nocardioides luti TaxID=2761101 RepID=A0A7X0RHY6_9ACTN|nr:DUF4012 domain-containing protein [Nocardioides luti]MBB6628502.1 DUF4012 domain-containing protein [Nocardioides luti]
MSRRERRTRRSPRSRVVRRVVAGLALVVVVLVLLAGWQLVQAAREVSQAKAQASSMKAALSGRDFVAAHRDAEALGATAADLKGRTDGLTWSAMSALPVVGSDLDALATASHGLTGVAQGAEQVTSVLAKPHGLLKGDRVSISAVRTIAAATDAAARGLGDLDTAVTALEDSKLPPVRAKATDLGAQVDAGLEGVEKFQPVIRQAPALLGAGGTRHYLLVFQNNAEVRATGGLLGSAARITADRGRLTLEQSFSPVLKTEQTKASFDFSASERALYGRDLDRGAVFLNSMPDFQRTSELLRQGWSSWFGNQLDGVISVDTVSLSYLLRATGPLNVLGESLTPDNAVDSLLSTAYSRYPDNAGQDRFFSAVAAKLFSGVTNGDVDTAALFTAFRRMADESRFQSQFFLPGASAVDVDPFGDEDVKRSAVTVGFNNTSGDKMSFYLRRTVKVRSISCSGDGQILRGRALLSSSAPVGGVGLAPRVTEVRPPNQYGGVWHHVPLGSQLVQVVIRAPAGGQVGAVEVDGRRRSVARAEQGGNDVVTLSVQVPAQESHVVTWDMATPNRPGDIDLVVTPGVEARSASSVASSSCS